MIAPGKGPQTRFSPCNHQTFPPPFFAVIICFYILGICVSRLSNCRRKPADLLVKFVTTFAGLCSVPHFFSTYFPTGRVDRHDFIISFNYLCLKLEHPAVSAAGMNRRKFRGASPTSCSWHRVIHDLKLMPCSINYWNACLPNFPS